MRIHRIIFGSAWVQRFGRFNPADPKIWLDNGRWVIITHNLIFYHFSTPESCKSSFLAWKLSKMLFDPESRAKLEESLGLDGPSRFLGMGYLYPLPLRFDSGYLLRSLTDLRRYGEIYPFNSIRLFNLFERSQSVQRIKRSPWILR